MASHMYHVGIAVKDFSQSKKFYDQLFIYLGWDKKFEADEAIAYTDGHFDYWVAQAESDVADQRATEHMHLAIRVGAKAEVDQLYVWLVAAGSKIDLKPQAYPEYGARYYSVFFYDPDGIRLEVVYA